MQYCEHCKASVGEGINFCPSCGKQIKKTQNSQSNNSGQNKSNNFSAQNINETIQNFNNTNEYTHEFDAADIQLNKTISLFAYIYILFLVPLLGAPNSKYARFHANQGIILCILNIAFNIILSIVQAILNVIPFLGWVSILLNVVRAIPFAFMIIGIINATSGRAKELPIIGKFKILK